MKESSTCSKFVNVGDIHLAFLTASTLDPNIFKAPNCSRYTGTEKGEVDEPYMFRRVGLASKEMVLYANASFVKRPSLHLP